MSYNHQIIEFSDSVVKRYVKTVPYAVTGFRLDPHNPANRLDWMLKTDEAQFDFDTKKVSGFNYENDVLELYSEQEVKLFERLNRRLIEEGVLKVYNEEAPEIDRANMLDDDEVSEIASIRQVTAFKKRISDITSVPTMERIIEAAHELNRPISIVNAAQGRLDEIKQDETAE